MAAGTLGEDLFCLLWQWMVLWLKHHHSITLIVMRQPAGIFHHEAKIKRNVPVVATGALSLMIMVLARHRQLPESHRPKFLLYDWLWSSVGRWSNYWVVYWMLSLPGWSIWLQTCWILQKGPYSASSSTVWRLCSIQNVDYRWICHSDSWKSWINVGTEDVKHIC